MSSKSEKIAILSTYSFVNIEDPELLFSKILLIGKKKSIKGTILLSHEGFNGTISGSRENLDLLVNEMIKQTSAISVTIKINYASHHPFDRFKIKIKPEIVSMGKGFIDVNNLKGEYVETKDWDEFVKRDDVILIDTRNDYEVEIGTFKHAIDPATKTFKQFPDWVENNKDLLRNKKIAMFCTGGVRCEKSTSYLKSLGYNSVYHLKGGILQYLKDTENKNNMWKGECFVFDERRSVDNNLAPSQHMDNNIDVK